MKSKRKGADFSAPFLILNNIIEGEKNDCE